MHLNIWREWEWNSFEMREKRQIERILCSNFNVLVFCVEHKILLGRFLFAYLPSIFSQFLDSYANQKCHTFFLFFCDIWNWWVNFNDSIHLVPTLFQEIKKSINYMSSFKGLGDSTCAAFLLLIGEKSNN